MAKSPPTFTWSHKPFEGSLETSFFVGITCEFFVHIFPGSFLRNDLTKLCTIHLCKGPLATMSEVYQILFSSPSASGFHPNGLTGGDGAWKSLSNPSVVIVTLNKPQTIHHISLENAGAATVEVTGLPQTSPIQGVNAKENTYLVRIFSFLLLHYCFDLFLTYILIIDNLRRQDISLTR